MKYIVDVNSKWMINVEAESAVSAEHKILEFPGVWSANAYDVIGMITMNTALKDVLQVREFLSMEELTRMSMAVAMTKAEIEVNIARCSEDERRIQELEKTLADAKKELADRKAMIAKMNNSYEKAVKNLGEPRI